MDKRSVSYYGEYMEHIIILFLLEEYDINIYRWNA